MEFGPAQYLRDGAERVLIAPEVTVNYGFAKGWEAVWEAELDHGLSSQSPKTRLSGNGAFLKRVLREGSLQDRWGPSVAAEVGVLLPGINGDHGTGASAAVIVSRQWPALTAHFNFAAGTSREHHAVSFISTILEGPREWRVRPVAELFHEHESGTHTTSALLGALWQARDRLTVDVAYREAKTIGHRVHELRAGLTYAWPVR